LSPHVPGDMFAVPAGTSMSFQASRGASPFEVFAREGDTFLVVHVDGGESLGNMTLLHMKSMHLLRVYNDTHTGLQKIV